MDSTTILSVLTVLVTLVLGQVSKRSDWISANLIPIQNIVIGVVFAVIEWVITKDFSVAIALSGVLAGGIYDVPSNLLKIFNEESE